MLGIAHLLGLVLAAFGLAYILPIGCSLATGDGLWTQFLLAAAITAVAGAALAAATFRYRRELKPRDGFLLVTLGWILLAASATLPLLLTLPGLSFTRAFFETMSGLTTTGSTVLDGLDSLAPSINFWRHSLIWLGGLAVIVVAVGVMPLLGVGGMQLSKAEAPGPVKEERLAPRVTETARSLWLVYALLTMSGVLALRLCGMTWFDAICHAFSAVALGGFSTHDASIGVFPLGGHRVRADRPHADLGTELRAPFRGATAAVAEALPPRSGGQDGRHSRCGQRRLHRRAAHVAWRLSDVRYRAALRGLQCRVAGNHDRVGDGGPGRLHHMARVRAHLDAFPLRHRLQHGIERRRHQDVPYAGAGAPGRAGAQAPRTPERRGPGTRRRAAR